MAETFQESRTAELKRIADVFREMANQVHSCRVSVALLGRDQDARRMDRLVDEMILLAHQMDHHHDGNVPHIRPDQEL